MPELDLSRSLAIQGWMSPDELTWLATQASRCTRIIELGVWKGRTTRALAEQTHGHVYAVDHWQGAAQGDDATSREVAAQGSEAIYQQCLANLRDLITAGRLTLVCGESLAVARQLRDTYGATFEMIFIDASHDEASVRADLRAYRPLLAPGGLLCGDDFGWPGVQRAVRDVLGRVRTPVGKLWAWNGG